MLELLRAAYAQHRRIALASGVCSLIWALLVGSQVPAVWRVEADVFVAEPALLHRLASPFTTLPDPDATMNGIDEKLLSHERLIALVKDLSLVDRAGDGVPWLARQLARLRAVVFRAGTEKEALETLAETLKERVAVTVKDRHVHLAVEWPTRGLAVAIAAAQLDALRNDEVRTELKALRGANAVLEERLAAVQKEEAEVAVLVEQELTRAAAEGRRPELTEATQRLGGLRGRREDFLVRSEDQRIEIDLLRAVSPLRYFVIRKPIAPAEPSSPSGAALGALWLLAGLLSALAAPLVLVAGSDVLLSRARVSAARQLRVGGQASLARAPTLPSGRAARGVLWALASLVGITAGLARGDPRLTVLPLIVAAVAWFVWTQPLKWPLLALMLAAITLDDPSDRPYYGYWRSPLYLPGKALFTNVAFFTGFELCLLVLAGVLVARRVLNRSIDPVVGQSPRPLRGALFVSLGTVAALVVFGLLRGGDLRHALWQCRFLLTMPVVAMLAMYAFEFPRDFRPLFGLLLLGSAVKVALGTFFIYGVARPRGLEPPHTTGHNDTMLLVTAALVPLWLLWERPTRQHLWLLLAWLPPVFLAIKLNDRRIAYVDLAIAAAFVYAVSPWHRMKRFATRAVVAAIPLLIAYTVVGWNRTYSRPFAPVQKLRSIVAPSEGTEEDSSNVEREIENFNLMRSWQANPVLGQGFGHAFTQYLPSNDFSQSNFGRIGHNSVLWLLWIGGVLGFTGVWAYLVVAAYLLGRTLRVTVAPRERTGLLVALSILLTYLSQAFGDMGTQSMLLNFFVAAALAITGRLATARGVWAVKGAGVASPLAMPAPSLGGPPDRPPTATASA